MKTKLFTLFLAVAASVGTMFAKEVKIGDLYYNLYAYSQMAEVAGNSSASGEIIIPASVTYNFVTYSVTSIGNYAFEYCNGLTSVTIPNSVTSIGDYAFRGCDSLTSVAIPNSVTSIGSSAFYKCTSLTSVTIPNSVTSIGNYAFEYCSSLTSVMIGNSVTSIGSNAFSGCSALTSVIIPNSVTSIGDYAFVDCTGLRSVTIPNSVTSIGECAFRNCSGLTSVTIPNSVSSIGEYAFCDCTSLTSVTIPNSVTSIGHSAFRNCSGLTSVTIPNSVTSIGDYAFYEVLNIVYSGSATGSPWGARNINGFVDGYIVYSDDTKTTLIACSTSAQGKIIIPNSVTSVEAYAFEYCNGLTSVTIPNSVTCIGDYAFAFCSGLTSVMIPNSVTSIGSYAFWYCSSLTSVTIGNSVTSIGNYAFEYCNGLTSVTIPNSVTSIGKCAFSGCNSVILNCNELLKKNYTSQSSLSSIVGGVDNLIIGDEVTRVGQFAFYGSSLKSVKIGYSVTSIVGDAFGHCPYLKTVTLNCGDFVSESFAKETPLSCVFGDQVLEYIFGDNVNKIGDNAFRHCLGISKIILGRNVTWIGNGAFYECKLTSITCKAVNTPFCHPQAFYNVDKSIPLYVPAQSINAYKFANQWKEFTNILPIEPEEEVSSFIGFEANNRLVDQINNENLIQDLVNVTVVQTPDQNYKHTINLINGGEGTFTMGGITFSFTHEEAGKIAYKTYNNYIQPNGVDREIRIPTYRGQSFKIILTEDCNGILIDGVPTNLVAGDNIITASKDGTTIKNPSNKPKINGILPIDGSQDINMVQDNQKSIAPRKVMIDGAIYILRGDKTYTLQGQEVK